MPVCATFVQMRHVANDPFAPVALSIDGCHTAYAATPDDALALVAETAKLPGWWPAASTTSAARTYPTISLAELDARAARRPAPFATRWRGRPAMSAEAFHAMGAR